MHIILQTSRLILRGFTDSDADAAFIVELNSNAEVLKYQHEPLLQDKHMPGKLCKLLSYHNTKNLRATGRCIKKNKLFIGWCGLKQQPDLDEIDRGYRLIQSAWGNGYATEAAAVTLQFGFEKLHLKTITGRAHINNIASLKILEKTGMQFIGEKIVDDCPVKHSGLKTPVINLNKMLKKNNYLRNVS